MTGTADNDWSAAARDLYSQLLEAWDKRNARNYALLFASDATLIGFDGSQINDQLQIGAHISEVFTHHQTPRYVGIVREVRSIAPDVSVLRANAGLIPPGKDDIDPALNAVQSLVAVKKGGAWKIALFQNTPAQFHMHPEQSKALTEELRARVREAAKGDDRQR
ncbi:MAG TPA: SgcJ/EcaC family oxidoreductase [Gemmatimonadaceae bacterium]|nr:SgcJ/EcaC family oxidoreductase [Gemmatimonadaceae bacterium]